VGLGRAAGRLIELGERERRAQAEASCSLSAGDFDGAAECVLGSSCIRRTALEQDVAARAMQF
jgi:hypothetical protein